jgi:hypothetical protein
MRIKNLIPGIVLFLGIGISASDAQTVIPASGGEALGNSGKVSYTIGQVIFTVNEGSTGTSIQGVHHPFEIFIVTAIKKAEEILLDVTAYPNPATDFIKLTIKDYDPTDLRYGLYDTNGSLLQDNKIVDRQTEIRIDGYVSSTYFLRVFDRGKVIKTFKIIKH